MEIENNPHKENTTMKIYTNNTAMTDKETCIFCTVAAILAISIVVTLVAALV